MRRWTLALLLVASTALAAPPKKKHSPGRKPPVTAPPMTPPTESPPPESPPDTTPADNTAAAETPPRTPVTTPAPAAPPPQQREEAPPPSKANVDLEGLNREYNALRDELFRSRAKAHLIGDALFKTKIVAQFQYKAQRAWPIKKVTLKIDDQPVFTVDSPSTTDPLKLYDGFAAPGKHTLALRVECGATGEDRVAYGAEGVFVVDVAENKQTNVGFVVDESGDGPSKLAKKREGTFDVRVRADLETVERTK
jgi:hypothetical protein